MMKVEEEQEKKENCFTYEICSNWDIKWQFNLGSLNKQDTKKDAHLQYQFMFDSNETVQNKVEQAINKLEYCYYDKKYDNNSTSTTTIVPKGDQKRTKQIRKMAEKAFKAFKMKLSDISKELQEDKNNMKLWFRKKLESVEDNARILEKCTKWIHKQLYKIDFDEFLKIVHKYTKSCQKEEAKRYKISDPSMIQKKSYVLHPNPPGEKSSKNAHLLLYNTCSAEDKTTRLIHVEVQLNVTKLIDHSIIQNINNNNSQSNSIINNNNQQEIMQSEEQNNINNNYNDGGFLNEYPITSNIQNNENNNDNDKNNSIKTRQNKLLSQSLNKNKCFITTSSNGNYIIKEKILWDVNQNEDKYIFQYAYHFIRDIIFEYNLINITKESIQDLWVQACKQIHEQIQGKKGLFENTKDICQFNSQEPLNSQKEHIIQLVIVIKNKSSQIIHQETLEWDIMCETNSPESFAEILIQDLGLEKNYVHEVSKQIREQILKYTTSKVEKIGKFYPEFHKTKTEEPWSRAKEKEFMKKKLAHTMSEDIPLIPDEYVSEDFPSFKNLELFNLIKANLDVMPPKFQDKLIAIEKIEVAQKTKKDNDSPFINIDKAMRCLDPNIILHDNPYVPQILRENRHINDLELELEKKRAVFNNPLLAAQMS